MNNIVFAVNINCDLENGSNVTNVTGFVIDNKRVYKTNDGTVLTGTQKIKKINSMSATNLGLINLYISQLEYE